MKLGLAFYDEQEDASQTPEEPRYRVGLDEIRSAGRAKGMDFYDGVIYIELTGDEEWRMRPTSQTAMHNLLSAINIYKAPVPTSSASETARSAGRHVLAHICILLPHSPIAALTKRDVTLPNPEPLLSLS